MRSIQTSYTFPLSSVKPLDGLLRYRAHCLEQTRKALQAPSRRREHSPVGGAQLEPFGQVEGFEYLRCTESDSIVLARLPDSADWARLLAEVSRYRHSPKAFHSSIEQSRSETVYVPKLEWIESSLRLQGISKPRLMEVTTPPSDFIALLQQSDAFQEVFTADEMELATGRWSIKCKGAGHPVEAAVLLESLDRSNDPAALLQAVKGCLVVGGLLFLTALVWSGFDMAVLGLRNVYLYPPDRTNCFSLRGLELLLSRAGFTLLEFSTPGVLDVEIVQAHFRHGVTVPLSAFEQELLNADEETHAAFQKFLQLGRMSSFARIVGRKQP